MVQIGWSWWIIGWMFPLLNHLFVHEIKITLSNQFSKFQAHTYLQWDKSATVTFLWYVFSQNTYLFHRHCGRHSISRNRMSKVTEALGVGKDCPLQKGTIKKMLSNSLSTHFSALPFYHKSKKASISWSSRLGISYNLYYFYLFFLSLYYRLCVECLLWVCILLPESLQCYDRALAP